MVWKAEDKAALPSCTTEGVNYLLECVAWRREGKRRVYNGETGRSPYQRGKEHMREIEEGVLAPLWFFTFGRNTMEEDRKS